MFKTYSVVQDKCSNHAPGPGSYYADSMNVSFFKRKFDNNGEVCTTVVKSSCRTKTEKRVKLNQNGEFPVSTWWRGEGRMLWIGTALRSVGGPCNYPRGTTPCPTLQSI